jgi:hypothetical protein
MIRKYSKTPDLGTKLVDDPVENKETSQEQKADNDSNKEQ